MNRKTYGRWIGVMVVLLAVSATTMLAGREELATNPSPANTLPSGLAAFAELLRRDGYLVRVDRNEAPVLHKTDLAVTPCLIGPSLMGQPRDLSKTTSGSVLQFLKSGGKVLSLNLPKDLASTTSTTQQRHVPFALDSDRILTIDYTPIQGGGLEFTDHKNGYKVYAEGGEVVSEVNRIGEGMWISLTSAVGVTNRYLGENDNAEYYLSLIHRLCPPGNEVVFVQATYGGFERQGLIGAFGSWAVALQWQTILVCLIAVASVWKRFGKVEEGLRVQRATRQLLDTLADTLKRSKKHHFAANLVARHSLKIHRTKLRLSPSTADLTVVKALDESAQQAFSSLTDVPTPMTLKDTVRNLSIFLTALDKATKTVKR